jgi:hypothetical protein
MIVDVLFGTLLKHFRKSAKIKPWIDAFANRV